MKLICSAIVGLLFLALWFGAFCFVNLTPDISQWSQDTRYFCVSLGFTGATFVSYTVFLFWKNLK